MVSRWSFRNYSTCLSTVKRKKNFWKLDKISRFYCVMNNGAPNLCLVFRVYYPDVSRNARKPSDSIKKIPHNFSKLHTIIAFMLTYEKNDIKAEQKTYFQRSFIYLSSCLLMTRILYIVLYHNVRFLNNTYLDVIV